MTLIRSVSLFPYFLQSRLILHGLPVSLQETPFEKGYI